MVVREVVVGPDGRRTTKVLPGYEDKPMPTLGGDKPMPKQTIKSKTQSKVKPSTNGHSKASEKAPFKATIMALNEDNVYAKKSQTELQDDNQLLQAFTRWLKSGSVGEFYASRRK